MENSKREVEKFEEGEPTVLEPNEVREPNRATRRALKSIEGRWRRGPRKRPQWMNYCKDLHEATIFRKVADQLGVSVPEMMRQATNKLINEALDEYRKVKPEEFAEIDAELNRSTKEGTTDNIPEEDGKEDSNA